MRPIQMVDTKTQYQKIKSEVDDAVIQVMESSAFINGKAVQDFSANLSAYLGVKHTIPCANGTDALQIAMMALDLKPGDELILFTWLHKADREVLETRPRNDDRLPLTGVFSTRSPDRPNPIGIHYVKVNEVLDGKQFSVPNLEVLDGTPLIDIKPHF